MQVGSYNVFAANFGNQCTYWAAQRYHAMTGIWVPMTGNAYEWDAEARAAGWIVASTPPRNVPSIICMQGNAGQGVESGFGHVAVVERVNADGSVYTSDYNWYPHVGDSVVVYVTFKPGRGVSFIWANNNAGELPVVQKAVNTVVTQVQNAKKTYSLASNASVATALKTFDDIFTMNNPFDVQNASTDNFDIPAVGSVSFTDPISWVVGFGQNLIDDLVAITLRIISIALGVFILYKVIDHFINFSGMIQGVASTAQSLAPLFAA